ncbi:hypothetical protein [Desulfitobacterium sp.]|uniref:hypothetical protein n=1 Tax=Desulfitobacterium sp. TaxID=49981 RepID=UPI002D104191|nr:hypothetical protein [Desulfitobacterium sp.]HVJ49831.1 hypothetical protein [Desulfitobacterium sp.]
MRKINWLVSSVALGLGMLIGIIGYAATTSPAAGNSLLTKFGVGSATQTVSSTVEPAAQADPSPDLNANPLFPPTASGENGIDSTVNAGALSSDQSPKIPSELSQKISNDYKQNIGYFFGAWQSTDMVKFRAQLAKAYVGDLYEKHARQAESFIIQGVGLEISDIRFDQLKLESATSTSATLEATYRYVAQDYNLGEQMTQGEKTEHLVHIRVNLILANGHWMISGETPLT